MPAGGRNKGKRATKCSRCGAPLNPDRPLYEGARCKRCIREPQLVWVSANKERLSLMEKYKHIERKYGLNREGFERILADQGGRCAICGGLPNDNRGFMVDHDHATGLVRGLLCIPCNVGLGNFKDNPSLMEQAAQYIRSNLKRNAA